MNNLIKNKKGSIAIIGIIISLIIVTAITGYITIVNSSWVYNEIQSIMDICTTNALQNSIDSEALRKEILGVKNNNGISASTTETSIKSDGTGRDTVDMNKVNATLESLFNKELKKNTSTGKMITNINIVKFSTELTYDSWGAVYGSKSKERPQLIMDSTVQITLKSSSEFDGLSNHSLKLYNARSGNDFNIKVNGTTADGRVVLTVRTLSRVLYK